MSEPNAYNKGLGSLFNFKDKLKRSRKFGRNNPPSFGGSVGPPPPIVDFFDQDLIGVYSLRKANPAYTGPAIQIFNPASASYDVQFNASGDLDTAAMQTWMNANLPGPFRIVQWYTQINGATNFLSALSGSLLPDRAPVIADASGVIFTNNGKPCIKFGFFSLPTWLSTSYTLTGSKYLVLSDLPASPPSTKTIFYFPNDATNPSSLALGSISRNGTTGRIAASESTSSLFVAVNTSSVSPPSRVLLNSITNTVSGITDLYFNGSLVPPASTNSQGVLPAQSYMHLGNIVGGDGYSNPSNTSYFIGNVQEVWLYSQPKEIIRSVLTSNIMQYWGL